jgi:trehalose 6-phosphate phosphatase
MTAPAPLMDRLPEIAARIDRAGRIVLGLDFDGTLTPIRPRPDDAVLSDTVRDLVRRLALVPRVTVVIVSGRNLAEVSARVGLPGLIYAGNHGMEIRGPGLSFIEPTADALIGPLEEHTRKLKERLAAVPGALVEPKGLTTSVHDRNVPDDFRDQLVAIVREVVAGDPDRFVLTSGHRVWEVRPAVSWHKGQALLWVLDHLEDGGDATADRLVFHLGDDRTDEDAFASLPDGVTVKVGPPDAPTRARYRLDDPSSVEQFLTWLLDHMRPTGEPSSRRDHLS